MSKARLVITAVVAEGRSQGEVARAYGVSQGWVSRLVARYRAEGKAAFEPRSRRPRTSPRAISGTAVELIVRLRKELAGQGLGAGPDTTAWHLQHRHQLQVSPATVSRGKHHNSALCHISTALLTRIIACWRAGTPYQIRDIDGTPLTTAQGRAIIAERYRIYDELRAKRRTSHAKQSPQPATIAQFHALLDTFTALCNHQRPHRSLPHRATPATACTVRPKAAPGDRATDTHDRVRTDRLDVNGAVTLRHGGKLYHIGIGRTHARTCVLLLVQDLHIRVINAATGELLRELTLDTTRSYQPTGQPPGPEVLDGRWGWSPFDHSWSEVFPSRRRCCTRLLDGTRPRAVVRCSLRPADNPSARDFRSELDRGAFTRARGGSLCKSLKVDSLERLRLRMNYNWDRNREVFAVTPHDQLVIPRYALMAEELIAIVGGGHKLRGLSVADAGRYCCCNLVMDQI